MEKIKGNDSHTCDYALKYYDGETLEATRHKKREYLTHTYTIVQKSHVECALEWQGKTERRSVTVQLRLAWSWQ